MAGHQPFPQNVSIMKSILKLILVFLVLTNVVYGQADSSHPSPPNPDDDFNVFLFIFAAVAGSAMLGAALAGVFLVTGFLFLAAVFVGIGVLSVSILAGIYKKSLTAGFKAFLFIGCPMFGMAIGAIGFTIIIELFTLDISHQSGFLAGIIGGFLGGLIMAFALSKITITLSKYLLKRFAN